MTYDDVLTEIIDGGIMGARHDYAKATHRYQLLGSVDGFEACRGKWPQELFSLLKAANERWEKARQDHAEDYFYHRCYAAEVEWVCNCLSVMMVNAGLEPLIPPTARAYLHMAEIVGVREP